MTDRISLRHITIVLKQPKYAGNIGSAARCAKNMGIERVIVAGEGEYDEAQMKQMATHCAADVVDGIRYFDTLDEALAGARYVVGTTARAGRSRLRQSVVDPRRMAEALIDVSKTNEVAIVFGPEDRGLTNDDLRYCDLVVTIPTADRMRSINLSHAVMIICYELLMASGVRPTSFTPRLAARGEMENMYRHLEEVLLKIEFINTQNPAHSMIGVRRFFSRVQLTAKDVKIVRGICRQVENCMEKATKDLTSTGGDRK